VRTHETRGVARVFGDDVNTDYIISSRRKRDTLDPVELSQFLFEDVDAGFAASVGSTDIIVAGENFGCGSAMEVAVTVILGAGIRVVVARSFSRTFYRNAINNGLLPIECDTADILEGDDVVVRVADRVSVEHPRTERTLTGTSFPNIMLSILEHGGLVEYLRREGRFVA